MPALKRLSIKITQTLRIIRKYILKLDLNKSKFEDKLLYKLSLYISKYYGKKVEFNVVNLKSIAYNADIFTEIFATRIKKERSGVIFNLNKMLGTVKLPKENTITERGRVQKTVNLDLVDNKYNNLNISSIINNNPNNLVKDSLNNLLYNLYFKSSNESSNENNNRQDSSEINSQNNTNYFLKIRDIILENIKYKNLSGTRLTVKGRLTRRYRADRAVYKLKYKGGLKNIDSAFKGLSTVVYRGYMDSNLEKSMVTSKRRIGSFAVKG